MNVREGVVRIVDKRGWLVGRFKVGDRVQVVGGERVGLVSKVMQSPRVTRYQVEGSPFTYFESDLKAVAA